MASRFRPVYGRASAAVFSCAYPLDAPSSEITSYMGLGLLALAVSNSNTTGTYTVAGTPVSQRTALAAPSGFSSATCATMPFTSGKRVIAWGISIPAAVNTGSSSAAYHVAVGLYTSALSHIASIEIRADKDGTFRATVYRAAGITSVYALPGIATAPTTVALVMDCDAGTFAAHIGGIPVNLSANTFTPSAMIALETVVEFTASNAGDAGKTVSATQYTQASLIPGQYKYGTADPCGNVLPPTYITVNGDYVTSQGQNVTL